MSKLSFQNQNTHFAIFIQGDINKYNLYIYNNYICIKYTLYIYNCYSKLFKKVFSKLSVNVANQVREQTLSQFERYHVTTPPYLRIYP